MSIPNEKEIYNIVKEYLSKHEKPVICIEKLNDKIVNQYEQPFPTLSMMAYKLMLFAEEQRIEKESMKKKIQDLELKWLRGCSSYSYNDDEFEAQFQKEYEEERNQWRRDMCTIS